MIIAELDLKKTIDRYLLTCPEQEYVELYNYIFKTDLHTSQITWDVQKFPYQRLRSVSIGKA